MKHIIQIIIPIDPDEFELRPEEVELSQPEQAMCVANDMLNGLSDIPFDQCTIKCEVDGQLLQKPVTEL